MFPTECLSYRSYEWKSGLFLKCEDVEAMLLTQEVLRIIQERVMSADAQTHFEEISLAETNDPFDRLMQSWKCEVFYIFANFLLWG